MKVLNTYGLMILIVQNGHFIQLSKMSTKRSLKGSSWIYFCLVILQEKIKSNDQLHREYGLKTLAISKFDSHRVVSVCCIYGKRFLMLCSIPDEAGIQRDHHEGNAAVSFGPSGGHGIHGLF